MNITVKVDVDAAVRSVRGIADSQIPWATALALTRTAEQVRDKVITGLPGKFTLRNTWWRARTRYGFNVGVAKKHDHRAWVYTRAPWMQLQETGGIKTPRGKMIAIPTSNVRRTKTQMITRCQRPCALLRKGKRKGFFAETKSGQLAIFQRTGRHRYPIRAMYQLRPTAKISERLMMLKTAQATVPEVWQKNFTEAFNEAIRTAK